MSFRIIPLSELFPIPESALLHEPVKITLHPVARNEVTLQVPLAIDVKELAEYIPHAQYGAPMEIGNYFKTTSHRITDPAHNNRMILSFDKNTDGKGFTRIFSDTPLDELAYLLSEVPDEELQQLKSTLAGTALEIPTIKEPKIRDVEVLEQTMTIGQEDNPGKFTSAEARQIIQHEVGFTDKKNARPILGTRGVGPCIAIAIYNPQTKTAALAHIDALTDLKSVEKLFSQLSQGENEALEIHLAGGDKENKISQQQVIDLIKIIQRHPNVKIISADLLSFDQLNGKSLAIDSRTGEVFTRFDPQQLERDPSLETKWKSTLLKMQLGPSPLHRGYDGRSRQGSTETSPVPAVKNPAHGLKM